MLYSLTWGRENTLTQRYSDTIPRLYTRKPTMPSCVLLKFLTFQVTRQSITLQIISAKVMSASGGLCCKDTTSFRNHQTFRGDFVISRWFSYRSWYRHPASDCSSKCRPSPSPQSDILRIFNPKIPKVSLFDVIVWISIVYI